MSTEPSPLLDLDPDQSQDLGQVQKTYSLVRRKTKAPQIEFLHQELRDLQRKIREKDPLPLQRQSAVDVSQFGERMVANFWATYQEGLPLEALFELLKVSQRDEFWRNPTTPAAFDRAMAAFVLEHKPLCPELSEMLFLDFLWETKWQQIISVFSKAEQQRLKYWLDQGICWFLNRQLEHAWTKIADAPAIISPAETIQTFHQDYQTILSPYPGFEPFGAHFLFSKIGTGRLSQAHLQGLEEMMGLSKYLHVAFHIEFLPEADFGEYLFQDALANQFQEVPKVAPFRHSQTAQSERKQLFKFLLIGLGILLVFFFFILVGLGPLMETLLN